jgi:D-glycero-D-manno-heptose 1,7-bisphosphate phosphatase
MRVAFFDRDGVLTHDSGYTHRLSDLRLFDDVVPALLSLQQHQIPVIVVTNQSGIARGLFTVNEAAIFNAALARTLAAEGLAIAPSDFYVCPHLPGDPHCNCRKPQIGLFTQAARHRPINFAMAFTIGDSETDVAAGIAAGTTAILLDRANLRPATSAAFRVTTLTAAADLVVAGYRA